MNIKLKKAIAILRSLPFSIIFNFHYLPFKQAVYFPILLYKPKFIKLKGTVEIHSDKMSFGMIQLGFFGVSIFPNSGIVWENHGGKCIFNGKCKIGNASAISIGKNGKLSFGNKFIATAQLKVVSYHSITFNECVLIGWDNTFMDTDFHALTELETYKQNRGFGSIVIGKNNWFGYKCITLKSTLTPDYCTVSSASILSRKYEFSPYCIIGGNPVVLKKEGFYRDPENDKIIYT